MIIAALHLIVRTLLLIELRRSLIALSDTGLTTRRNKNLKMKDENETSENKKTKSEKVKIK